ncbi:MAG: segregation/condensation protein A [Parcubacteria group bacterium]|nr:segregation/condensation protein A [Parcubacteria group bacterium]
MSSQEGQGYKVKTRTFEGPLDLLLTLIQERKLHISDVSLAEITDDYISYIESLPEFPTREAADFILVASTLVLIKSRALLPALTLTEEEEENIENLEERLRLLKRMRDLVPIVRERYGAAIVYYREPSKDIIPVFAPTGELTAPNLLSTVMNVLKRLPKISDIPQIMVRKVISLEEMMDDLAGRIRGALAISFKEFARDKKDTIGIVVSFLAMLELVKRGIITVRQDKHFEDIAMESGDVATPKYL